MASLMPNGKQQYFTVTGAPLVGGKLYTYAAGSTSPLSTFSDKAGAVPNTNPVILDSRGEATMFWGQAGYKVVLQDAAGAVIWTQDNLYPVQDSSSQVFAQQLITAVASQTIFPLSISYTVGNNSIAAYMNGLRLPSTDFVETNTTTVTLNAGATVGDELLFVAGTYTGTSATASSILYNPAGTGAVTTTVETKLRESVSAKDFGAKGDGTTDDTAAFTAMFALGVAWYIPSGNYKISSKLTITSSGRCDGVLVAAAGFVGHLVDIVNAAYGVKLNIYGLNCYSTDVRPNPYTGAQTIGIFVGPNATYSGNTPTPGVNLYGCRATRFSYGCWIGTFNVTCFSCEFPQNDHNLMVYSNDTSFNQINDVSLINCACDSAASSVGQAYALRVGTYGNATYTPSGSQGVNLLVQGCNFDGAPVYLDNILGVTYTQNYHEQGAGYTYFGAALVLGSAGASYLSNVLINPCWFTQFYYGIDVVTQVTNLKIKSSNYASIAYSAVRYRTTEQGNLSYENGVANGSTDWTLGTGCSEFQTNYSSGIAISQLDFISSDFINSGQQIAPATTSTTNWLKLGITNDGNKQFSSGSPGRLRSGAAIKTAIAGNQVGRVFTFTTLAQAKSFNGGDRISSNVGGASFINSVDYAAGTAILDSVNTSAVTISHNAAYFIGYALSGSGSPAGVVTANPGSTYVNISGGAATTFYVKESGTGTAGWVAK
jgi:Pectate lyase superfamily protein